jgi:hypothetical protein
LGHLPSYPIHKQAQIIVACMALHNFIRNSALYDDEFREDFHDEASIGIDEYDIGAFRDSIAVALLG